MFKRVVELFIQVLSSTRNNLVTNIESILIASWVITLILFVLLLFAVPLVSYSDYGFMTALVKLIAVLATLLCALYGVWAIIDPKNACLGLLRRWFFVEAQPSDLAIILTRVGGVILTATGIIVLVTVILLVR